MQVNYSEFLGLVYADIFSFPLKRAELKRWAINTPEVEGKVKSKNMGIKEGFVFIKNRKGLVELRKRREKISERKLQLIKDKVNKLRTLNTIEAIFVTGSVAAANAKEDADLDVLIITTPGTVWRTRLKLLFLLRKTNELRDKTHITDKICANMFLDTTKLEIIEKNVYTAHEVVLAKCVFDKGGVEKKWQQENRWVQEFLPNAFKGVGAVRGKPAIKVQIPNPFEIAAFLAQYVYMLPKMTNEKVGLKFAFFHPRDGAKWVLSRFEKRLRELS